MSNNSSIDDVLKNAKLKLKSVDIPTFSLDAELLLMHILKISRVELVTKSHTILTSLEQEEYFKLIQRRLKLEPVQYIINKSEFMGLDFYVDKHVLIPRGDTECLVEEALNYINKNKCKNIIDMCTGSGCISVSISYLSPYVDRVTAVDISKDALSVARQNAIFHNVFDKINFVESDMFSNLQSDMKNSIDLIISNPPYIDTEIIDTLGENVKNYEPILALDGKEQGLYFYKEIAKKSKFYLNKSGKLFLEIGFDQAHSVQNIFLEAGYKKVNVIKDLSGLDRVIVVDR